MSEKPKNENNGSRRKPWMKFYPADWQSDDGLRQCSLSARGLWIEMIAIMHKSAVYGHLLIAGQKPSDDQLATSIGVTAKVIKTGMIELEKWSVFSRTEDGVIYSRRMVEDRAKEERDIENGRGGGNPHLKSNPEKQNDEGVNPPLNPQVNAVDNAPDKAHMLNARNSEERKEESFLLTPLEGTDTASGRRKTVSKSADALFDEWFALYPLHTCRNDARKAWKEATKTTDPREILEATRNYAFRADPKYIPEPDNWLKKERWRELPQDQPGNRDRAHLQTRPAARKLTPHQQAMVNAGLNPFEFSSTVIDQEGAPFAGLTLQ